MTTTSSAFYAWHGDTVWAHPYAHDVPGGCAISGALLSDTVTRLGLTIVPGEPPAPLLLPAEWSFKSDLSARRRFFHDSAFSHPAKLHLGLLQRLIDLYTVPGETILDPMAGTGSLMLAATQMRNVILRDLEPSYVDLMLSSLPIIRREAGLFAGLIDLGQADAKTLECPPFDHIITSPPYGIETSGGSPEVLASRAARLAANVGTSRRWQTYINQPTHASFANGFRYDGKQANTGNKSGRNYWRDMSAIYERCAMFLPPHGKLILILKNHYRRGKLIDVVSQTIAVVESLKLKLIARHGRLIDNPSLWQRRRREQGLPIVDIEDVLVFAQSAPVTLPLFGGG